MIIRSLPILFFIFSFCLVNAQELKEINTNPKTYTAVRTETPPLIDGILTDPEWNTITVATDFVMIEPGDGTPIRETHTTEVKIIYDDEAIYIAAYMRDDNPDKILRQFTQRDEEGQSDLFGIDINTYNDGINQTRFIVTAAGTQIDAKINGDNQDSSYNLVWESDISFDDKGWYAELKIPYSALRFPEKEEQIWGIQLVRSILNINEFYGWNYIDKSVGKSTQYNGLLKGIRNIDPPVRLSFYPYTSLQVNNFQDNTETNFSAGLDFKYGISDAFTLDATLIPDFGQTAFDNVELNLGPFEQKFNENRAFFTEGTELFSIGDLFYSRRIGDTPTNFNVVEENVNKDEIIIKNPDKVSLLNALKISGRTDNNLGIGLFNAVTKTTYATILDTLTDISREIVTEPLTNYNIFVLNQQFNQSSSISLINTNVTREGHFRDGNVTGLLYDIYNKANSFNFTGEAKISNVNKNQNNISGFASEFGIQHTKGIIRYGVSHSLANETYDINDLGLNFRNNYNNFGANVNYRTLEPTDSFNQLNLSLNLNHNRRYRPDTETSTSLSVNLFAATKNRFAFGAYLEGSSEEKDFFEPRVDGRFATYSPYAGGLAFISTDYRKRFAVDSRVAYFGGIDSDRYNFRFSVSPRFRFNDKFTLIYSFSNNIRNNRNSYVAIEEEDIVFGKRDQKSIENSIRASYNFNTDQALNLNFRNFWSSATYEDGEYTSLQEKGTYSPKEYAITEDNDPNANFNIWNLDFSYSWRFAPGSEAILLYRNSIFNFDNKSELQFTKSLQNLFDQDLRQNLSLRIVYYIDYNNVKNIFKS